MRNSIKKSLDSLRLSDIYSLMLFICYKIQDIPDYATQLNTYQFYIDSYKKNDFSRFNVLRKYADSNFYAATELGDIYFNGEKFIFSENYNNI